MTAVLATLILRFAAQDTIDGLVHRLADDDPEIRDEASRRLMERGLDDLPRLEETLRRAEDPEARARLARILPNIRKLKYAALIEELSKDGEMERAVAKALAQPNAEEALRPMKNSGGTKVDRVVAALLDVFRDDEEVFRAVLREHRLSIPIEYAPRVLPCLSDADGLLCANAIASLEYFRRWSGAKTPVDWNDVAGKVTAIARDGDPLRRLAALSALPVLGDDRSIDAILTGLAAERVGDIQVALKVLREFLVSRPAMADRARAAEPLLAAPSEDVRRLACEALAVAPRPDVDVELVRRALASERPRALWGALELAGALGDASFADAVAALVPEKNLGAKAVETLFRLSVPRAGDSLAACLRHHPGVTEAMIDDLNREFPPETLDPIRERLAAVVEQGDAKTRTAALRIAGRVDAWFDAEAVAEAGVDGDKDIRQDVFARIGRLASPKGVEVIRRGLTDAEPDVRNEAIEAVGRLKVAAFRDDLLSLLDGDPSARGLTIRALTQLRDRTVLPRLIPYFREHGSEVADAVESMATEEDVPTILDMARKMKEPAQTSAAISVAAKLLGEKAVDFLKPLVEDRRLRAAALVELANRGAVDFAPQASLYLDDADAGVVKAAASLVGQSRFTDAIPRLLKLFEHADVGWAAARALARMPKERVALEIAPYLQSKETALRERAAWLLNELDADPLADRLADVLADASSDVAQHAIAMVVRRRLGQHLDAIEVLSRRPESRVRVKALAALAELDWSGRRASLLGRMRKGEQEVAPLFVARRDEEALALLLDRIREDGDAGWEALILLNGYRMPEPFTAASRSVRGISHESGLSARQRARRLTREVGIEFLVDVPRRLTRISFEDYFDGGRSRITSIRSGGYGGTGDHTLIEKISAAFGTSYVPIFEERAVRIVTREAAVQFWTQWAAERRR